LRQPRPLQAGRGCVLRRSIYPERGKKRREREFVRGEVGRVRVGARVTSKVVVSPAMRCSCPSRMQLIQKAEVPASQAMAAKMGISWKEQICTAKKLHSC
jgi:hypothetical protein